jgi:hypothetical protein
MPRQHRIAVAALVLLAAPVVFSRAYAAAPRAAQPIAMAAHITDYVHVPDDELARASAEASRIWSGIDVTLSWTHADAATRNPSRRILDDGPPIDVDVLLLRQDMAQRMILQEHRGPGVLARAVPEALRVYVFYDRVRNESVEFKDAPGIILGRVVAHELGHVLLGHSHSSSGLMRAEPDLGSKFLAFAPADGAKIRDGILAKTAAQTR